MIHTDGNPTIADPRSDRLVTDTEKALAKIEKVSNGVFERRTVIVAAHVRICGTTLDPESWRATVENALRGKISVVADDNIDVTIEHVSTDR